MIDIIEFDRFRDIKYYDRDHSYLIDGHRGFGVTGFISKFKQPFDSEKIASKKSQELGIDKNLILDEWENAKHLGVDKGQLFHSYAENYLNNKIYPNTHPTDEALISNMEILKEMFHRFVSDTANVLVPIKSELVVGDYESLLCGTIDQIYYNKKHDTLEIWDWKTNKKIAKENKYANFKEPISHIDQSELNVYSLQLSCYKYIVEKTTKLKISECYLAWFNENNPKYKIFKCFDYTNEVKLMLEYNR